MSIRFIILSVFLYLGMSLSYAQNSARKSVKLAESAIRQSKFGEAASHYEAAWKDKPSKIKYIYQAGEYYALIRDYAKAADAYSNIRNNTDFPLAQLYYARALKQSGVPDKAAREYADFMSSYAGKDADALRDIVQQEIRGCEFAQQSIKAVAKSPLQAIRLSDRINSIEADFAPVAFADDLLYFSSNVSGRASIYRSQKQNGSWSRASIPTSFPELKNKDFCNGAFSPDNKRFYYTECEAKENLSTQCAIYVMVRKGESWSSPIRLPDAVNEKGFTSTHPSVSQLGDKEILYFSSNKTGTIGGMDIWQTSRDVTAGDVAFGAVTNLGAAINSGGDEITPYFDAADNTLYFASNGHISMGGLDILRNKYSTINNAWGKVENVGAPINSSADDYYYVKNKTKSGGFLVSNRAGKERQHTLNEDIFEFSFPPKNLSIKGQVLERSNSAVVTEPRLNLYEILNNGQKRLLNTKICKDGAYEFTLVPDKRFRVEAEKKGFMTASHEFVAVKDSINNGIEKNLYLEEPQKESDISLSNYIEDKKNTTPNATTTKPNSGVVTKPSTATKPNVSNNPKPAVVVANTPVKTPPPTVSNNSNDTKVVVSAPKKSNLEELTAKGSTSVGTMPLYETVSKTNERLVTSAPKLDGVYYKIQVAATKRFDMEEPRYLPIRGLGRIDTEYIVNKDMVRVLIADFMQYEEAQNMLTEVKKSREFTGAYIIKYENGIRIGTGK